MISTLFVVYMIIFNGSHGYFYYYGGNVSHISVQLNQFHFNDSGAASQLLKPFLPTTGENLSLSSGTFTFAFSAVPNGQTRTNFEGKSYVIEKMNLTLSLGNSTFHGYAYVFQDGLIYNLSAGPLTMQLKDTNYQLSSSTPISPVPFYVASAFVGGAVVAYVLSRVKRPKGGQSVTKRDTPYWVD